MEKCYICGKEIIKTDESNYIPVHHTNDPFEPAHKVCCGTINIYYLPFIEEEENIYILECKKVFIILMQILGWKI